jgi:hypothetical protein
LIVNNKQKNLLNDWFKSNTITSNFSLPTQSQLNCIGGDGCIYSKYLNYIDCYNVQKDLLGYSQWICYPDKFFNYYIYPKIVEFGTIIVECENCPDSDINNLSNDGYDQQLIYGFSSDIKKINGSCSLNYQMYKLDSNLINIYKNSNNVHDTYVDNNVIKFLIICISTVVITFILVIVVYKIVHLIIDYYKKSKYIKLTDKDFEDVILINNKNEYRNIEIV